MHNLIQRHMKIKAFLLLGAFALFVGACKDDDKEKFSSSSPEEHRESMEDNALDVFGKLKRAADLESIDLLIELAQLLDNADLEPGIYAADFNRSIIDKLEIARVLPGLKSTSDEKFSFKEGFEAYVGIYTYNSETESWDKEEASNELTFKFTSKEGKAVVTTLDNVSTFSGVHPGLEYELADFPTSARYSLKADDKELISMNFVSVFDSKGIPSKIEEVLKVEDFEYVYKFALTSSVYSIEQMYKYQDETLLSYQFENKGSFDTEELLTGEVDDVIYDGMLSNSNLRVTVGKYRAEGKADWNGLNKRLASVSEDDITSEEEMAQLIADTYNKYIDIKIRDTKAKTIIATGEFYAYEDDYYDGSWDINMRMVFPDGSYMDESFFQDGFTDLVTEVNEFFAELENKFRGIR